jgi:hypothetical protein
MRHNRLSIALAVLAAAGLAYDAKVHLHLAGGYDAVGSTITQGALFRIQAVVALATAIALLVIDRRVLWIAAGLTGLAGVAAVVLYRYVDVGAIGPIPDMYEPIWYAEKTRSAIAEGGVAIVCVVRELIRLASRTPPRSASATRPTTRAT